MMTISQLKSAILTQEPREFVESHIVSDRSCFVTDEQIKKVRNAVSRATGIELQSSEITVVGSAKVGFGLFEKKRRDQATLPAFRPFDGHSDIDFAFSSPALFDAIWSELAVYANGKPWMPHRMNKLGDYLVYGWIRPDHIPIGARLTTYDLWRDTIRQLNASTHFNRRKLSGALYRNIEFLIKYHSRGIAQCKVNLESP